MCFEDIRGENDRKIKENRERCRWRECRVEMASKDKFVRKGRSAR